MSVTPIAAPTLEGPAGPAAATQRIRQLQELIANVQAGPAGFAAALRAAQTGAPNPTAAQTAAGALPTASEAGVLPASEASTISAASVAGTISAASVAGTIPAASGAGTIPAALPSSGSGGLGSEYDALIERAAARNGVDPAVLHGLIQQESGFDPNSTSSAGALGLTQLMPGTAASLGVTNPLDPAQSIEGGARYLGEMLRRFAGSTEDALAAYNAGPGAVQRYGGVPPYSETQQYVTKVLGYAAAYRGSHPAGIAQPGAAASSQAAIA